MWTGRCGMRGSGRGRVRLCVAVAGFAHLRYGAYCAGAAGRAGADLRRRSERYLDAAAAGHPCEHQVRATFFLLGSRAEAQPELVRRIAAAGHMIGNHSWSHPNLAYSMREPRSRGAAADQRNAAADHGRAGKVFPAALWGAAAGGVSHCARDGHEAGAVERDDLGLERAFSGADCGTADEEDRRA